MDGLHCDPMSFNKKCEKTNAIFHKNQKRGDIKSHHYIISFDPADTSECGLTGEKAQALCLDFSRKNFPGYQAPVHNKISESLKKGSYRYLHPKRNRRIYAESLGANYGKAYLEQQFQNHLIDKVRPHVSSKDGRITGISCIDAAEKVTREIVQSTLLYRGDKYKDYLSCLEVMAVVLKLEEKYTEAFSVYEKILIHLHFKLAQYTITPGFREFKFIENKKAAHDKHFLLLITAF